VDNGRGNYDHILVGPPGVFLLDSKNWTGITSIVNGRPKLGRRHDPNADPRLGRVRDAILGASAEISREILKRTGRRAWVNAVVVFWNEFPDGLVEADRITHVHGARLLRFLEDQPAKLDPTTVAAVACAVRSLDTNRERTLKRRPG
jgi:hypothetical protein